MPRSLTKSENVFSSVVLAGSTLTLITYSIMAKSGEQFHTFRVNYFFTIASFGRLLNAKLTVITATSFDYVLTGSNLTCHVIGSMFEIERLETSSGETC